MIATMIPYCPAATDGGKNLGFAYNALMERLQEDDWACFLDHDACFTTRNWYPQLEDIISGLTEPAVLTAVTNRIGCPWQRVPGVDRKNHSMVYHREIGTARQREFGTQITRIEGGTLLSGVVILLAKKTWQRLGGFTDGLLGVDNRLHQAAREASCPVYLMPGVYVYHWYRAA